MSKKLVAFFSASGTTKKVAQMIAEEVKADLFEIEPKVPYTKADLDWMNKKSRSSVEMSDKKYRPEIMKKKMDMSSYDEILLGFPIWWYVAPTIVNTFLEAYDFSGKKIVLFATSGGSGFGNTVKELQPSAPDALCLAAKRGVDVRIITPGIPDKKFIYNITRSFYHGLVKHGVRVYEWTPGFCHAKMSVADDCMATCGTINLDYRSLYHHFENGCFMADCQAVVEIKNDLIRTMGECRDVTDQYQTGRSAYLRLGQLFMRLFAGLL